MTKRMLIDGTHAEETRVVVLDGNRLEDFDVETSTKKQLKGNIYLAKIVRVEPSLQAAFVEYGASRHGFLAFGEIHPDYYQIPVADRQALIAQQEQEAREAEAAEDEAARADEAGETAAPPQAAEMIDAGVGDHPPIGAAFDTQDVPAESPLSDWPVEATPHAQPETMAQARLFGADQYADQLLGNYESDPVAALAEIGLTVEADGQVTGDPQAMAQLEDLLTGAPPLDEPSSGAFESETFQPDAGQPDAGQPDAGEPDATEPETVGSEPNKTSDLEPLPALPPPEILGGEQPEERERRTPSPRYLRNYKIQEVIRRRQIMLVQVVKEERGGKGAALTTYISLAGRFCVLMPNSPRGGGISRKITSSADRRRLKEITTELEIPSGMGLIVRTAGAARPKPEIRRDCEYLLQLWDDIRDTTMKSVAPALIYEEASLIKRVIRDVYSRDVDEVLVDGEAAWHAARDQMRLLMPSHAHKVQLWHDPNGTPLFAHQQVDIQLDAMLSPNVQLRSGGYLVINQTEALVAIDVNSGRSTRERGIEETAVRTNLEAAEEVARQLRLRDLAGLIVIDFIDMEQRRHNSMVEKKLSESLKNDRARIQLGSISSFGLMEMSRQRLRPSLAETSFVQCPHCSGTGLVRSTEGASIQVLRSIEEEGAKRRSAEIMVHVAGPVAMYILNHKRDRLREIETRTGMTVLFTPDPTLLPPAVRIDRLRALAPGEAPPPTAIQARTVQPADEDDSVQIIEDEDEQDEAVPVPALQAAAPQAAAAEAATPQSTAEAPRPGETAEGAARRRRRRRRRGGRRDDAGRPAAEVSPLAQPGAEQPDIDGAGVTGDDEDDRPETAPATAQSSEASGHSEPGGTNAPSADAAFTESTSRRRGRRGGRRRRKEEGGEPIANAAEPFEPFVPFVPSNVYVGPTPADPFGGGLPFDIFDAIEQAEARAEAPLAPPRAPVIQQPPEPAPLPAPVPEPEPLAAAAAASAPPPKSAAVPEADSLPALIDAELPIPEPETPALAAPPTRAPRVRKSRAKVPPPAESLLPENPSPSSAPEATAPVEPPTQPTPPAPLAAEPANDSAAPEPLIKPVLVDDTPPAPRKGWWRR